MNKEIYLKNLYKKSLKSFGLFVSKVKYLKKHIILLKKDFKEMNLWKSSKNFN